MFFDIFEALCKAKGVSCRKAATDMGLSNSTATKWKKTGATPDTTTLSAVAHYFNVSVDYLINGEEKEKPATQKDDGLTPLEIQLEGLLKRLPVEQKRFLLAQIETLLRQQSEE